MAISMAAAAAAMTSRAAFHSPAQLQKKTSSFPPRSIASLGSRTSLAYGSGALAFSPNNMEKRKLPITRTAIRAVATEVDIAQIVPQADRVLVRLETLAEQSAGGVLLPKSAVKFERYLVGEIIAAGAEVTNVQKGQKVMFSDTTAYEVNLGTSDKLCFCRSGDLLATVA